MPSTLDQTNRAYAAALRSYRRTLTEYRLVARMFGPASQEATEMWGVSARARTHAMRLRSWRAGFLVNDWRLAQ